jgi:hypothetical protein
VHVPFPGDPMLLRLRPSRWASVFPRAEIGAGELVHRFPGSQKSSEQVTVSFNGFWTSITQYLDATQANGPRILPCGGQSLPNRDRPSLAPSSQ